MGLKGYILVTPCKNEETSLPKLAESVINQTIRPDLWIIVDDGSTDGTSVILEKLVTENDWIKSLRLCQKPRDLGIHVAHVYRMGFDHAISECAEKQIEYEYVGCVDGDIVLDHNYFEDLIAEFGKNSNLGICSGHIGNIIEGKVVWSNFNEDLPSGGARLWNRKCFEETGGYLLTCSPDSVSNVKAKLKGWDTRLFEQVKAMSTRPYAGAEGQFKGFKKLGSNNYFIGYTPIHALLKGIKLLYSRNGYFKSGVGIAYISGYFVNYLRKNPRIDDLEVLEYYKKARLKEILWSKLKSQKEAN